MVACCTHTWQFRTCWRRRLACWHSPLPAGAPCCCTGWGSGRRETRPSPQSSGWCSRPGDATTQHTCGVGNTQECERGWTCCLGPDLWIRPLHPVECFWSGIVTLNSGFLVEKMIQWASRGGQTLSQSAPRTGLTAVSSCTRVGVITMATAIDKLFAAIRAVLHWGMSTHVFSISPDRS